MKNIFTKIKQLLCSHHHWGFIDENLKCKGCGKVENMFDSFTSNEL